MSYLLDERRIPRVSCDLSVEYQAKDARTQRGRITDISTAGARITTQDAFPTIGADVMLRFHLPLTKRPIQAMGNVRWANQGFAGVEFGDLRHQAQDEIWRYYARQLARQRGVRPPELSDTKRDGEVLGEGVLDAWWRFIRESE